jgi:hypothetical protein
VTPAVRWAAMTHPPAQPLDGLAPRLPEAP